jgi:DNA invertase Pin-like site-specific DNA recombinase
LVNALEEFRELGIDFISLHEGERELIRDRVRSGLAAVKAKGKKLGRPRLDCDPARIAALRDSGASWRTISHQTGISVRSVRRLAEGCGKNPSETRLVSA